ncbi:carboxymuconolactone decarboxylase family protein [Aureimonas sp. AU4]|uniref:carboxymuconolactone decarboxylase family protein n=1 Tax=Aureimonas sp. AU4 TaxID=1638163 RepID=UPI000A891564|nr:hypothetical protein [Aureimonas sp. AU4]
MFADLWARPRLSPCDRSLNMSSAVVRGGSTAQTRGHFNRALDNGVTLAELGETITYFGWSNALLPVADTREVFMGRGIVAAALVASPTVPLAVTQYRELVDSPSVDVNVRPARHALANYTDRISMADLTPRSQLALRNRSLAVVAIKVPGVRLPKAVLAFSDVDVPPLG